MERNLFCWYPHNMRPLKNSTFLQPQFFLTIYLPFLLWNRSHNRCEIRHIASRIWYFLVLKSGFMQIQGNIFAYRVDFMGYVFFLDLIVFYEYFTEVPEKCTRKKSDSDGFVKSSNSRRANFGIMRRTDRTLNDYEMQHNAEVALFTKSSRKTILRVYLDGRKSFCNRRQHGGIRMPAM